METKLQQELKDLETKTKAMIDSAIDKVLNKYISKAEDGKDVEETDN